MNKKSLILLVLPAFLLGGCNKEISAADAKAKAKEIEEHEVKAEDYNALSVSTKMSTSAVGKAEGQEGNEKGEMETLIEFSVDKNFIHTKSYMKDEDVKNSKTEVAESETWVYLKDDVFYSAVRTNDGTEEKKNYTTVEGIADVVKAAFKTSLDASVKSALAEASDKTYLQAVEGLADGKTEEGATYTVKYYTAGDGNLTVEGSVSFTDYEYGGVKGSGSGKVKYAWDKYLLAELAVSMDFSAKDTESDTDVTMKMDMNEKLSFDCKVNYPDLSSFQKVVL